MQVDQAADGIGMGPHVVDRRGLGPPHARQPVLQPSLGSVNSRCDLRPRIVRLDQRRHAQSSDGGAKGMVCTGHGAKMFRSFVLVAEPQLPLGF